MAPEMPERLLKTSTFQSPEQIMEIFGAIQTISCAFGEHGRNLVTSLSPEDETKTK